MTRDRDTLLAIATAVADRSPIDWMREIDAHRGLEREIRVLQAVEHMGAAYQHLQQSEKKRQ